MKNLLALRHKKRFKKDRFSVLTVIMLVVLILFTASLFIQLLWAFITTFKAQSEFRLNIIGLPKDWVWNYSSVIEMFYVIIGTSEGTEYVGIPEMAFNSIAYALGCSFTSTAMPCMLGYLCARFPYKYSKGIYFIAIVTMFISLVGTMPSQIQIMKALGLYGHIWGLWIMSANFGGVHFMIFYGMCQGISMDYTNAARLDGAGNLTIFFRIIFPMLGSTFLTIMLIKFIAYWNDYYTPLIYAPENPTLALGVFQMSTTNINQMSTVPMRLTAAMLLLIPILAIFVVFHNRIMDNLNIGGIKG